MNNQHGKHGFLHNLNQVRRRQARLVLHRGEGTVSVRDSNGHWHRRLREIPEDLFWGLPRKLRSKLNIAECYLGRPLVKGTKLIVNLAKR
jgi:hypothetical protein